MSKTTDQLRRQVREFAETESASPRLELLLMDIVGELERISAHLLDDLTPTTNEGARK